MPAGNYFMRLRMPVDVEHVRAARVIGELRLHMRPGAFPNRDNYSARRMVIGTIGGIVPLRFAPHKQLDGLCPRKDSPVQSRETSRAGIGDAFLRCYGDRN